MSTILDPAKLKVVELRAELSARGLDAKGNKPVLVKRLKDALEQEMQQELPDTSIADTSTEDLDNSQNKEASAEVDNAVESPAKDDEQTSHQSMETEPVIEPEEADESAEELNGQSQGDEKTISKPEEYQTPEVAESLENGNNIEQDDGGEPKNRKSRWGSVTETPQQVQEDQVADSENSQQSEQLQQTETPAEQRGDKRKRSSPSPERSQRRRSKSPIKEDEPPIDQEKVQLSWYDSDLHLQVDKENFLSARPYHEGAFGYAWAGVRATHGISSGKVCFEVKITEELKWEDIIRQLDKNRKDRDNHRKHHESEKKNSSSGGKNENKNPEGENASEDVEKSQDVTEASQESMENPQESSEPAVEDSSAEKQEKAEQDVIQEENSAGEDQKVESKEEDVSEQMEVDVKENDPISSHMFRVGWSLSNTGLQLGEYKQSYAYESTGKFVTEKQFSDYGITFGVGDVIGSYVDINTESVSITFAVNGVPQPTAVVVPRTDFPEDGFALFPHVLSRNYAFELNLGSRDEPWFPNPEDLADYIYLENAEPKVAGPVRPETRSECEVIMMCGLPASGKTHWVREWVEKNPEKRYTVIGNTQLLEKMTVNGNPLKNSYKNRWNVVLDKLQKCLNKLVESAALRRRNYVIDQTNLFPSVQRRKMRPFEGFKRRAVVVVAGEEEQAKREALKEEQGSKDIPNSAVLEMKANMSIPRVGEWIEEVEFPELGEEEAKATVQKYNSQGREAGFGNLPYGHRRDNRPQRWQNNRRDYRSGGYRDNRGYMGNHYERGPRHGGWQRPRSGSWNRNDHRDMRGPPGGGNRDWRNSGGSGGRTQDRGHDRSRSQSGSYNRNRSGGGGWGQGGNWQGSGSYGQSGWAQGGGSWGQSQGTWGQGQGWGQSQNWKYGQGYNQNYGNYPNYYYGQYPQNWSNSQPAQRQPSGAAANSSGMQYGQASQNMWVQYAQQYTQGQAKSASTQQETPQK